MRIFFWPFYFLNSQPVQYCLSTVKADFPHSAPEKICTNTPRDNALPPLYVCLNPVTLTLKLCHLTYMCFDQERKHQSSAMWPLLPQSQQMSLRRVIVSVNMTRLSMVGTDVSLHGWSAQNGHRCWLTQIFPLGIYSSFLSLDQLIKKKLPTKIHKKWTTKYIHIHVGMSVQFSSTM